jgi:hypothetical protein
VARCCAVSTVKYSICVEPNQAFETLYNEMFSLCKASYRQTADIARRLSALGDARDSAE